MLKRLFILFLTLIQVLVIVTENVAHSQERTQARDLLSA